MNKIDELICQYCPDGVDFKALVDITTWDKRFNGVGNKTVSFKHVSAAQLKQLEVPNGDVKLLATGKFDGYTTEEIASKYLNKGEVITIPSGGSANLKYYSGKFVDSGNILAIAKNDKINLKFVYYFLLTKNELIQSYFRGSGVAHPNMSEILQIKIPVPPLEVQKEIVNILDKFTQLEAELSAELEARRRQYEFYRNQLLELNDSKSDLKLLSLGEITIPTNNIKWKEAEDISFEYIDLSSVSREDHSVMETSRINRNNAPSRAQKLVQEGDVIFATTRPTLRRYTMIGVKHDGQVASTGYCVLRPNKDIITSQWIYHNIAKSGFNDYVEKNQEGSAYPAISDSKVKAFTIPVPSIDEQKRIVLLLDKFDKLVNSISEGIPAEIAARRKQYEYYRTKLLTFKELK